MKSSHNWTALPEDLSSDDEVFDSDKRSLSGKTRTNSIGRSRFRYMYFVLINDSFPRLI